MKSSLITLDPNDLDDSLRQLAAQVDLSAETQAILRRIVALFPRPASLSIEDSNRLLYEDSPLTDQFTFDVENDDLILFSREADALPDALIEMAMYLQGFATMIGSEEEWVVEFTIGAWKPVRNRIKRQLNIPVRDHPRGVVGLPPSPDHEAAGDPYPFRTLVSNYDTSSFQQMIVLAGRDDIAVYFPPETHVKVLAVYAYTRRAMHEIAQGIGLKDYETFNTRLIEMLQRLQTLFNPAHLAAPGSEDASTPAADTPPRQLNLFPAEPEGTLPLQRHGTPFEDFIEGQLFAGEETDENDRGGKSPHRE